VATGGRVTPVRVRPALVEADVVGVLPCVDGSHVNKAGHRPKDAPSRDALAPESPRGPCSQPPGDATPGDMISASMSSYNVDLGANELGLPGYPRVPLLPTN
jgi:hypothetical protein